MKPATILPKQVAGKPILVSQHVRRPASSSRSTMVRVILGILLMLVGAAVATTPFMSMLATSRTTQAQDNAHDKAARALTLRARKRQWKAAKAYNARLFASGQPVLGQETDPFTATPREESRWGADYRRQLTLPPDGVMSTIRYPRLGISLPVRHGTSLRILSEGAGHLYGTSLPVGGKNTNTVISAHSGLTDKVMFDKLDGLGGHARKGDVFYLTTLGWDLAYRVVDIKVVTPGDFKALRIVPGRDLVTLLTCTPYGVNTMRLLVIGRRANIPKQAPPVSKAPQDLSWLWWVAGILAVWAAIATMAYKAYRRA